MAAAKTMVLASVCCALLSLAAAVGAESGKATKTFFMDVPRPATSNQKEDPRIWHGSVARPGQFPYYVAMYMDMNHFCGGSLIHPKWVVTAAHCVDGTSVWTLFIGALSMQLAKERGREVHVSRGGVLHPQYDKHLISHDVGLVQLLHAVSLGNNDRIGLVRLTAPGQDNVGTTPTVVGFGLTGDNARVMSQTLRYASLRVVSNDVCFDRYGAADASQLCVRTDEVQASSCRGDSGGPLVLHGEDGLAVLIGATSFGSSAGCTAGLPVGFSNLAGFIGWIARTTGVPYPFDRQQA